MLYNSIECPTCGNETTAKSIKEPQKCRWCRRLFRVTLKRKNKEGQKAKYNWEVEPVDFEDEAPRIRSLEDYTHNDIYGRSK